MALHFLKLKLVVTIFIMAKTENKEKLINSLLKAYMMPKAYNSIFTNPNFYKPNHEIQKSHFCKRNLFCEFIEFLPRNIISFWYKSCWQNVFDKQKIMFDRSAHSSRLNSVNIMLQIIRKMNSEINISKVINFASDVGNCSKFGYISEIFGLY